MTLRIRKTLERELVILSLSGRIVEEDLGHLETLLNTERQLQRQGIGIDLKEVKLVDRQVVRFLAFCESGGVQLRNCPAYIREWIETGGSASHEQRI